MKEPASTNSLTVPAFILQEDPLIYISAVPGPWLIEHTTPSWRMKDPKKGFQRVVQDRRVREIAVAVLEQRRTFPNALVLATDASHFQFSGGVLALPASSKFLVVDGQHRLWAQTHSTFPAMYATVIHMGLTEQEMAQLFLEINDNQKRVPSSLRWDLIRLVRPEDDPMAIAATDLTYLLATEEDSPLFQRIDLTGEQAEIQLKQGSLAPDIKRLIKHRAVQQLTFDEQYLLLVQFFLGLKDRDGDGWRTGNSAFYKARVVRALLQVLPDILADAGIKPTDVGADIVLQYLTRIPETSLDPDRIRQAQGNAGIKAIADQIRQQIFSQAG